MTIDEAKETLNRARKMTAHEQHRLRVEITEAMKILLIESKDEEEFSKYAEGIVLFSAILYFILNQLGRLG